MSFCVEISLLAPGALFWLFVLLASTRYVFSLVSKRMVSTQVKQSGVNNFKSKVSLRLKIVNSVVHGFHEGHKEKGSFCMLQSGQGGYSRSWGTSLQYARRLFRFCRRLRPRTCDPLSGGGWRRLAQTGAPFLHPNAECPHWLQTLHNVSALLGI